MTSGTKTTREKRANLHTTISPKTAEYLAATEDQYGIATGRAIDIVVILLEELRALQDAPRIKKSEVIPVKELIKPEELPSSSIF